MKYNSAFGFGFALALLATACNGNTGDDDTSGTTALQPFETEWETVVNTSFPVADIGTISIGRKVFNENFANRGDIEVAFDQDGETIIVEMRKYTLVGTQDEANAAFDKISLWAYVNSGNPSKPSDMDPADDCTAAWQDGCQVLAYYDGQSQPVRTGVDFKVHLPKAYRGTLNVTTEDNLAEDAYKLRGDVTVLDLCSNGDIELENGVAQIRMCPGLQETPTCSDTLVQECEDLKWDPSGCGCDDFGQLKVASSEPYAANIIIDFPGDSVWANVSLENLASDCLAKFDNCGGNCTLEQSGETLYKGKAEYNYPGMPAIPGVGFAINAEAGGCAGVFYADGPDDYVDGAMDSPKNETRGDLVTCTGCLAGLTI